MRDWTNSELPDGLRLLRASDCEPRAVDWVWRYWLPSRTVSILAGAPGSGKTTVALAIASVISNGSLWPDGTRFGDSQNVVIWSGEDEINTTLIPRLIAADADLSRVHFVTNIQDRGTIREFDPSTDMRELTLKISEIGGAALVIVDPLVSAVAGDLHRANDVRRDMHDLVVLARSGPSVLGISHFSKGSKGSAPLERVLGSQAFGALARVVLVAAKRQGQEERVLLRAKSNIGPDGDGFEYTVQQRVIHPGIETSYVSWGEALVGDTEEIMREVERDDAVPTRLELAKDFLLDLLQGSDRVAAKDVFERAAAAGHSASTVNRAKSTLRVSVEKAGNGGWFWRLPDEPTSPR